MPGPRTPEAIEKFKRTMAAKKAAGWTPQRRAKHSKMMKAKYKTGWHPTKGKRRNIENKGYKNMTQAEKRRIWRERSQAKRDAAKKQARKSKAGGARPGSGRPRSMASLNGSGAVIRANKPPKHMPPVVNVLEADGAMHAYVLTNVWTYVRQP